MRRTVRRRTIALMIATTAALAMSGCTSDQDAAAPPLPEVTVERVDVPDEMLRTSLSAAVAGQLLPGSRNLPHLLGGSAMEPGAAAVPAVWVSDDAQEWRQVEVDPEFEGSFSGGAAGSEELSVVAGTAWRDGATEAVAWVSADRDHWDALELPADFADEKQISAMSVVGERVLLLGVDNDDDVEGLIIEGDEVIEMDLPDIADGQLLRPGSITAGGDIVVMTASTGVEGEQAPFVAYRSTDGGATWDDTAIPIGDRNASAYGVVWTGDVFVATGYRSSSDAPGAPYAPAAWSSTDAADWTEEAVPGASEFDYYATPDSDVWLGYPTAANGVVATMGGNQNQAYSALYLRDTAGTWTVAGYTGFLDGNGIAGWAVPLEDSSILGVADETGVERVGVLRAGEWTDTAAIGTYEETYSALDVTPSGEGALLSLSRAEFTVDPAGTWRNFSSIRSATFDGDEIIALTQPDPERIQDLISVVRASDDDAGEVVIGSSFPPGAGVILLEGFHRSSPDAEWQPAAGFPAEGAASVYAVSHTEVGWVAVGGYRTDSVVSTTNHGRTWISADGVTWTEATGDFDRGALETRLYDVCELPNGEPIAVGYVEENTNAYRAAAWTLDGSTWRQAELDGVPQGRGWIESCAADDDGVVVLAQVSGRDVLLRTEDGSEWETVFEGERGIGLIGPVAVDGGFAAAGTWSDEHTALPVVWVSADGSEWTPLAVPSLQAGSTGAVARVGDDLLVTMSPTVGHPVLIVRDIAEVIAREGE